MAEGGGNEDQRKRRVRLMSPDPPRPFEAFRGRPPFVREMVSSIQVLKCPSLESENDYNNMLRDNNYQIVFHVDCAFNPYSEEWVTATVDIFRLQDGPYDVLINNGPFVFMARLSVSSDERNVIPFKRSAKTSTTAFNPDGNRIAWQNLAYFTVFARSDERRVAVHREICCCAFSPDGGTLASLSAEYDMYTVHLSLRDPDSLDTSAGYSFLLDLDPDNYPSRFTPDNPCYLQWTRCGRYLALSTSFKVLVVIKVKVLMETESRDPALLSHDALNDLSYPRAFDFSSRVVESSREFSLLALGTSAGFVRLYQFSDDGLGEMVGESDMRENQAPNTNFTINCLRFSNAEQLLAVAMSNGFIDLLDSQSLLPIMSVGPANFSNELPRGMTFYHGFSSLSFACTDNFLAAGATDGLLRVWCVRRPVGPLMDLCRTVIRSHCKIEDMSQLPLPSRVLSYLTAIDF